MVLLKTCVLLDALENVKTTPTCSFPGRREDACNCSPDKNHTAGFFVTVRLGNLPKLKNADSREFIRNQIKRNFKAQLPNVGVEFGRIELNVGGAADVTLRIYSDTKKDEEALKSVFATRRFIGNLTFHDEDINFRPILSTMSLSVNKPGTLRMKDDFILSCAARGSSRMTFRWIKDGLVINTSHSAGRKWNRIIKDPHVDGQYTALLGVSDADVLDEGVFTCQVEDFGFQRCMSKRIRIKRAPVITLDPITLTVRRGENFTVKCFRYDEDPLKRHTYSWTKNRELLPVRGEWGNYEILYPEGSILQIYKMDKPATYSCLVQDGTTSSEASVQVLVVAKDGIRTYCNREEYLRVHWPETAPDAENRQICPNSYIGIVSRQCVFSTFGPTWLTPDFSKCTFADLQGTLNEFHSYRLGYESSIGPAEMLDVVQKYLDGRRLLPGEGGRMLDLIRDVISGGGFTSSSKTDGKRNLLELIDRIMEQRDSLINEMQIVLLQNVVREMVISHFSQRVNGSQTIFHQNSTMIDLSLGLVNKKKVPILHVPFSKRIYPRWFSYELEVNVEHTSIEGDSRLILVSVVYRNLSSFLPQRSAIRLDDGAEIDYVLLSEMTSIWFVETKDDKMKFQQLHGATLSMEFGHKTRNVSLMNWEARCAVSDLAKFENSWDISACNTEHVNETTTRCFCTKTGTFAVILTNRNQKIFSGKFEIERFVVILGCSICFIMSTASGIVLLIYWTHNRTCLLFVKLQCCFSISGAMVVFIVALTKADNNQSASFAMCMMVFLETFLLIAASTQLSKLLLVYAEFVQLPKPSSVKLTVIGVITGVPLITVFGNHTAHKAMNVKFKTWWIVTGSLSFNVFMTCFVIIILLYVFVYFVVESKIHQFLKFHQKNIGCFQQRIYLLHRSALIFVFLVATILSSIAFVNYNNKVYWHYEFSIVSMSLGLVIVVSYVAKKDDVSYPDIIDKLKIEKNIFITNSNNEHLTFYTKEEAEAESESTPEAKYMSKTTKVRFAEPQIDLIEHPPEVISNDVLDYNCSPKSFRKNVLENNRPEKECLELDLVISFRHEASTKTFEQQSKSNDKIQFTTFQKKDEKTECKSDLDVVLSSISQDLDYLLNQEEDLRDTLKRKRLKSPKKSGETVVKRPEALTDLSRTHC